MLARPRSSPLSSASGHAAACDCSLVRVHPSLARAYYTHAITVFFRDAPAYCDLTSHLGYHSMSTCKVQEHKCNSSGAQFIISLSSLNWAEPRPATGEGESRSTLAWLYIPDLPLCLRFGLGPSTALPHSCECSLLRPSGTP